MSAAPTGLIHDAGPEPRRDVPDFLAPGEAVTGFAYDPFTDHFFLRLAPGNRLRVVARPARAVKRDFVADALPVTGGGDVAVWPRNGHLFLVHPREASVVELTRLGARVREIPLSGLDSPAAGLAFDATAQRLLVLAQTTPGLVTLHDLEGRAVGRVTLERSVRPSLAFDGEAREYYAPLAETPGMIGIFDEHGRLRRIQPLPADFIDVGPRSLLRMF